MSTSAASSLSLDLSDLSLPPPVAPDPQAVLSTGALTKARRAQIGVFEKLGLVGLTPVQMKHRNPLRDAPFLAEALLISGVVLCLLRAEHEAARAVPPLLASVESLSHSQRIALAEIASASGYIEVAEALVDLLPTERRLDALVRLLPAHLDRVGKYLVESGGDDVGAVERLAEVLSPILTPLAEHVEAMQAAGDEEQVQLALGNVRHVRLALGAASLSHPDLVVCYALLLEGTMFEPGLTSLRPGAERLAAIGGAIESATKSTKSTNGAADPCRPLPSVGDEPLALAHAALRELSHDLAWAARSLGVRLPREAMNGT